MVPLWLGFAKWRRQKSWGKKPLPTCFLCRVKGWGKRWKRRRKEEEKKRRRRQRELKWKDPTSQVAPITGTFGSQFLQKALAAIPQSLPFSLPRSLCSLLSNSFFSCFFLFLTVLRSQWGHYSWVTSCSRFPSVCEVVPSLGELWATADVFVGLQQ